MLCRVSELRYKEMINVTDGSRYGYVGDAEVDLETGQVRALVVPGRLRFFGLLGREDYLRYREGYGRQEKALHVQMEQLSQAGESGPLHHPWVEALLRYGKLTELDRVTVAETIIVGTVPDSYVYFHGNLEEAEDYVMNNAGP